MPSDSQDWRQIVDAIPDLIMVLDRRYTILWANRMMSEHMNLAVEDMVGQRCYQLIHGTSVPVKNCPYARMLANGRTYRTELYEEKIGGLFLITVSPYYNRQGQLKGGIHIARDIAHIKKVENKLRENETRYRALSEATFEGVFISKNGFCLDANQRTTELFGYTHDELIGIFGTELIAPASKGLVKRKMLSGDEKPYEALAQKKNGTKFYVEIRGKMMRYRGKRVRVAVIRDINEHKLADIAQQKSEKKYRRLIENIPDIIFSTDKDGNVTDFHLPDQTFFGYKIGEIIDRHFSFILDSQDEEHVMSTIKNALHQRSKFIKGLRCRIITKNGTANWVEANLRLKFDDQGICIRSDGVIRDISNLKNTEEKLKRSNRELKTAYNKRKMLSTQLIELLEKDRHQIAMEIHDHMGQALSTFRTGFNAIAKQLGKENTAISALVKSIEEKSVQELLELKNISYKLRPTMLDHLGLVPSIRTLIEDFENSTEMQILFFDKDIPRDIEPEMALALYRIAQEALTNIVRHAHASKVYINLIKKDDSVLLSIEDNGVGFDKQQKGFSSNGKSLLGIHIMRERAVHAGGELTIESQVGRGTQVLAEVPL